jgi:quercetin dioxygenase-like cupin family protein
VIVKAADLKPGALPGRVSADPFPEESGTGLSMRVVEIVPGERNPHRHPHSVEVMYVVQGTGKLWENGLVQDVGTGDCILIPRDVPHATVADEGSVLRLVCFLPHPDLASNIQEMQGMIDPAGGGVST